MPDPHNSGWITLHRKIQDHWIYSNNEYFSAWVKIIFDVNHSDSDPILIKGKLLSCKRGESLNSIDTWTRIFGKGWTTQKTRTFFKLLLSQQMINTVGVGVTTKLTVCKYDDYQKGQRADNEHEQQKTTSKQRALNEHLTTNNNVNNVNNENKQKKETAKAVAARISDLYNSTRGSMSECKAVTSRRVSAINARVDEHGESVVFDVIAMAQASDFLQGRTEACFKCGIDWIFNSANFLKIIEGNYANKDRRQVNHPTGSVHITNSMNPEDYMPS